MNDMLEYRMRLKKAYRKGYEDGAKGETRDENMWGAILKSYMKGNMKGRKTLTDFKIK